MQEKDLSKYYWLQKEIKKLDELIKEFGDGIKSSQFNDVSVSGSHQSQSIQEKKMELLSRLTEKRLTALETYNEIDRYIDSIDDEEIKMIMILRHLDLKTWNQVADELSSGDVILTEDAVRKRYKRFLDKKKEG